MRQGLIEFRPEGQYEPGRGELRTIMFSIGHDDHPVTSSDCRGYEKPIRIWLADTHPGTSISEIWFSRPEILKWPPRPATRCAQDVIVEGGAAVNSGHAYRFRLELHAGFCNCAWCQDEDIVAGWWRWIDLGDTDSKT